MFIEHIGTLIYRSLWSEMLDDRKFYFPISSKESQGPPGGPFRGMQLRKWRPVGPDEVVVMDTDRPFVGDQSPRIRLDPSASHGIRQSGLALVKGKKYAGRIYLRGNLSSKVKVSLIWGEGANDRQTISFATLSEVYKKLVKYRPKETSAYLNIGEAYMSFNPPKFDDALGYYRKAYELDPHSAFAALRIGQILARNGDREQAARFLKQATADSAANPTIAAEATRTLHEMAGF
jgi:hypothetical protein